jgi:hypothetical protein
MEERHFNLIDEPWLKAIDSQGQTQLVSLEDTF